MKGKVAVVTGSTSGIGLGIAERLAAAGCDIMLNSRRHAAAIDDLCAEMGHRNGVRVRFGPADMSRPGEVEGLIDAATKELGQVDVLVNNAGIQYTAPVHEFPPEKWDAIVAINLSSVFHATRIVLPQMLARGWGRIINVASTHGLVASAHKSAYVAAKHGVVGLTKVVALETAETGVTCNAICPGWVPDAPRCEADRGSHPGRRPTLRRRQARSARREAALQGVRDGRAATRSGSVPVHAGGGSDPRPGHRNGRRLDRATRVGLHEQRVESDAPASDHS